MLMNIKDSEEHVRFSPINIDTNHHGKYIPARNHKFGFLKLVSQYFESIVQRVWRAAQKSHHNHHPNFAAALNTFLVWIGAPKSTLSDSKYWNENQIGRASCRERV